MSVSSTSRRSVVCPVLGKKWEKPASMIPESDKEKLNKCFESPRAVDGTGTALQKAVVHGISQEGVSTREKAVKPISGVQHRFPAKSWLVGSPKGIPFMQQPGGKVLRKTKSLPDVRCLGEADALECETLGLGKWVLEKSPLDELLAITERPESSQYDRDAGNAFASGIVTAVNDGGVCLLISLGHQLGLFSVMAKLNDRPRSATSIASAANNLRVRYVQEILSAMTCVGIVEETKHVLPVQKSSTNPVIKATRQFMNPQPGSTAEGMAADYVAVKAGNQTQICLKYRLPPEHAVFLTWNSGQDNLALLAQYVPVLARLEDEVVNCFRTGEGLDWTRYGQFDLVSELDTSQTFGSIGRFELEVLGLVPGLAQSLREGTSVLCLGSGLGSTFANLALSFQKSWFTIYETNQQKAAVAASAHDAIPNLHFRYLSDGLAHESEIMAEKRTYTAAFILDGSVVRDAYAPGDLLQNVHRALRPECPLIYFEYNLKTGRNISPAGPLLHGISTLQSVPLGLMAGGPALGRTWGAANAGKALEEAGFAQVKHHHRDGDLMNVVIVATSEGLESN